MKPIFVLLSLLFVFANTAAQEQPLDPDAVPDKGIAAGGVGFRPDPFRVEAVTGGGEIDARTRNLGGDCSGAITVQPDFRFTALTPFDELHFIFIADAVTADAALVIRDPNGNYRCNDDSYGVRNPTIDIEPAPAGDYNVWVGARTERVFGDLYVTTRGDITPRSLGLNIPLLTPSPVIAPTATPIPATALNPTLPASSGTDDLTAGFLPDPYYRIVFGGGALDAAESTVGDECFGYAAGAPVFRLNWSGSSTRLRFLFAPFDDAADGALIVLDPEGAWHCNRDFAGGYARPQVEFVNPLAGTYTVWVSNEAARNEAAPGALYVTEKQYSPETVPAAGTAPTGAIGGLTPGVSAFVFDAAAPDPYAIPGSLGGGDIDMGAQNANCPGMYTAFPSFGFTLSQPTEYLRVFFVSDEPRADAALIVQMPDGTWYCNDDSFRTKQPTVDVIGNLATGGVSVWVGSFNPGESIPGTLYLTHGSASPLAPTRRPPVLVRN
jgi:serine protease Do